ncbi:MAG: DUF4861 domain-containing protein [Ignavibacteriaceae bacterium]
MKIKLSILIALFFIVFFVFKKNYSQDSLSAFSITVENDLNEERTDEIVEINIKDLKAKYPGFNVNAFLVKEGEKEIPSQLEDINGDGKNDKILFLASFKPNETKKIEINFSEPGKIKKEYPKRTQAQLGVKKDYQLKNGYYTGGKFENADSAVVPKDHFAHDALYRFEGPGWESDLVAYRFYLDSRNRTDIFGKKTNELVLQKVGVNDLVSDSKETYTQMLDWGMDIFKVGETLGIGSFAAWIDGKVLTVSDVEKITAKISVDGIIRSDVYTKYLNWKINNKTTDLFSNLSISAGSRLTKVNLNLSNPVEMCAGLAKHENTNFITSNDNELQFGYIGLYGSQSLSGDSLGIALFYKKNDLNKVTEDSLSNIVVFKKDKKNIEYYFAAAWQSEPDGITSQRDFKKYLHETALKLDHPLKIKL